MPLHKRSNEETAEHVAACLQLAILLEINAPKPGNVHRNANFHKTNYEHFLASTVAAAPSFKIAAMQGIKVAERKINLSNVGIGRIIKDAIERINTWQHGGNTLLGTVILLSPIAVAAGKTLKENNNAFDLQKIRKNIKAVTTATKPEDAVALYEAISTAKPGGLNKAPRFDVTKASSKQEILETHTTLFDVFKISARYDSVSNEWTNNYSIVFDTGFPFLKKELTKNSINNAVVHTFLKILAETPDTLIARKVGWKKANKISDQARQILQLGGLKTQKGRNVLATFDKKLRDSENKLNPGTTADLITATLALHVLSGYRP
jgi:triphosphoribosyl-dephospho-CoA synthase